MIIEVGRICRKLRGKNAGKYCVIVDKVDKNFVLADGMGMKRQKINIIHLEPLPKVLEIKKGETSEAVIKELEKENLE